jgi:hypothetical protein
MYIVSQDESLVLTGPKRGLALISYNYIETDLKIKDHQGEDRELSKGYLMIKCASRRSFGTLNPYFKMFLHDELYFIVRFFSAICAHCV